MFFIMAGGSTASMILSMLFSFGWMVFSQQGGSSHWFLHDTSMLIGIFAACVCLPIALSCRTGAVLDRWRGAETGHRLRQAEVHALVNELPIETWLDQSSSRHASVSELRRRVCRRHPKFDASSCLEKCDLVAELERSPHDTLCAICYEEYTVGEPLRLLRCSHYFHIECACAPGSLLRCVPTARPFSLIRGCRTRACAGASTDGSSRRRGACPRARCATAASTRACTMAPPSQTFLRRCPQQPKLAGSDGCWC